MKATKPHRGILIDQIPADGAVGLIFALGMVLIFSIGIPEIRQFLPVALLGGLVVAALRYYWLNQTNW